MREWLRKARKEAGLSQKQLGEMIGLSQQMIAKAEQGLGISVPSAKKISKALEVDWTKFFEQ